MKMTPPKLYKYISPQRLSVLEALQIRFTQPSALNDPFEFNLLFSEPVSVQELRTQYDATDTEKLIQESLKSLSSEEKSLLSLLPPNVLNNITKKLMDKTILSRQLEDIHDKYIVPHTETLRKSIWNTLNRTIGILSLSSDGASSPMWANYADNSRGVAIAFDTSKKFFDRRRSLSDEFLHLRQVIYEDRHSGGTISQTNPDILIQKSQNWEYEKEWRMLAPLEVADKKITTNEGDEIFLFDLPPDTISEVVLGLNSNQETVEKTKNIIYKNSSLSHVQIKQIHKGPTGFLIGPAS